MRQHLQRMAYGAGKVDARLDTECPREAAALWRSFLRLASARPQGMASSGLLFTEIESFQRLYDYRFSGWELDLLFDLFSLHMNAQAEDAARRKAQAKGRAK